jgi:hypothetical protein
MSAIILTTRVFHIGRLELETLWLTFGEFVEE